MTLEQPANIVEILGVIALVSAMFFGWLQIRQHRSATPAYEAFRHWQSG